jgi:hypothetical protein
LKATVADVRRVSTKAV